MTRRLAVVPARSGSKRVPNKNIRSFGGRPMIAHVLETAQRSALFETIHVSTESQLVADVVENLGYKIQFLRPSTLAEDQTPLMPVLRHCTEAFLERGQRFDEIWLLMACAALIDPEDLMGAARLCTETRGEWAVLSVASYPVPLEWAFTRDSDGRLHPTEQGKFAIRSQDLETRYYDSGTFCGFPVRRILQSTGAGDDGGFVGYVLPRHKAIDIDSEDDWRFAEILFAGSRRLRAG